MYADFAPIALQRMMQPSISACGLRSMSSRSLNVPGSDSSAFTTRYRSPLPMNDTFMPVGKPAPPRPRRPESFSSWTISSNGRPAWERATA
jgi:hypothetical protein